MAKNSNKKNNKNDKYNSDNEIIIGVTTKPTEKVRVEKKKTTTRTNTKSTPEKKGNIIEKNRKSTKNNIKNTNRTEWDKEKRIKKINRKKVIFSISMVLVISIGALIFYLTTPAFNITNLDIYGNEKNTLDTYISLSKINIGTTNIFAVKRGDIRNNIKVNPYVEDITISRKLPNRLEIYITERKVLYQIEYLNKYIYIDGQGYILEISEEKENVPIIKGFVTIEENIQLGQRLKNEDLIKLNVVAKIINHCKYNAIENKITNIDVTDETNYIVEFKKDKKTVYIGDASNLSERLSLLKTILKNEKNKPIEIFMNGKVNEDDVYIRYIED